MTSTLRRWSRRKTVRLVVLTTLAYSALFYLPGF